MRAGKVEKDSWGTSVLSRVARVDNAFPLWNTPALSVCVLPQRCSRAIRRRALLLAFSDNFFTRMDRALAAEKERREQAEGKGQADVVDEIEFKAIPADLMTVAETLVKVRTVMSLSLNLFYG